MCVSVPDIFVLVNGDFVKLLRIEFILQRAHVSDHLQGNKAGQDRQHQTFLFGEIILSALEYVSRKPFVVLTA